ncbi:MAG: zinc ribbon domain-containing protein, partial [Thermoplasmata archaeon]|nr:zinc ribbon domain-containing protein [Thermoplasmata archaeon]
MRFHPEHLDNALDGERGSAYALPGPSGDLKHAIGQSIRKGKRVIVITASFEAKHLMDKFELDAKKVIIIDWHTYQTRSIVGVEEEDNVLYCARDLMNVNMAINKALRAVRQEDVVIVVDALPQIVNLFGIDSAYSFLSKNLAKIGMNSITGLFVAPDVFFDSPENQILSGLLEYLPTDAPELPEIPAEEPVLERPAKKPESKYDRVISRVLDNLGISKDDLGDDFNEFGIWLCFECGAFVDKDAKACPTCDAPVELVIHTNEDIMDIEELVSKCPECGVPIHLDSDMCGVCGHVFSENDREDMLGQGLMDVVEEVSDDEIGFVVCPDCGSFVNKTRESCGLCGAIIDLKTAQEIGSEEQVADELAGLLVTELEFDDDLDSVFSERSFIMCPECGASVDSSKETCAICGTNLADVDGHMPDISKAALATMEKAKPSQPDDEKLADPIPPSEDPDGYWYKDEDELYMCPNCGSFISSNAENCEVCGVVFDIDDEDIEVEPVVETVLCPECQTVVSASAISCPICSHQLAEVKDTDEYWVKEQKGLFMCPMCGSFLPDDATGCGSCGVVFEDDDEDDGSDEPRERACPECGGSITPDEEKCGICGHDIDMDGFWFKKQKGLFMCPGCGTFLSEDVEGCHSCGIAFDSGEEEIDVPEVAVCPNCQADLEPGDGVCSICGFDFSLDVKGEVESDKFDELLMCPVCGAFISAHSTGCLNCGAKFDDSSPDEAQEEIVPEK